MHILLAEDDLRLGKLIKHLLEKEKNQVEWVQRGDEVYDYVSFTNYDVIILDWMLPGQSGDEVCDCLRKDGYQGAILMLTARDAVEDKVTCLNKGADDYLIKPFEFIELMARLHALSRRGRFPITEQIIQNGKFLLNRTTHVLKYGAMEVQLTSREFQILDLLLQNYGHVVPREVIIDRIWGLDTEVTSNNLDAYIRIIRKKLDFSSDKPLISNVRGIGYKIEDKHV